MATITRAPSNTWKAVIRKHGWPTAMKTFRAKRDAEDWTRGTRTKWCAVCVQIVTHCV
ncbi:MAG: hypothetical protein PVH54_08940 [Gammaproteobacteria bacterium]